MTASLYESRLAVSTPQRELGLEAGGRVLDVAHLVGAGVDPEQDLLHPLRREVALEPDFLGALDGRVRQVAGGVILEEIVAQMPTGRRLAQCLFGIEVVALRGGEALVAFQRIAARGKALGGEPRGAQAVLRRGAGMQWLAHRAEVGFQPGGLGGGDAEGDGELLVAQA